MAQVNYQEIGEQVTIARPSEALHKLRALVAAVRVVETYGEGGEGREVEGRGGEGRGRRGGKGRGREGRGDVGSFQGTQTVLMVHGPSPLPSPSRHAPPGCSSTCSEH